MYSFVLVIWKTENNNIVGMAEVRKERGTLFPLSHLRRSWSGLHSFLGTNATNPDWTALAPSLCYMWVISESLSLLLSV